MLTFKIFQSASNFDLKSQKLIESANNIYKIIETQETSATLFLNEKNTFIPDFLLDYPRPNEERNPDFPRELGQR